MQAIIVVNKGLEEAAARNVSEILDRKISHKIYPEYLLLEVNDYDEIIRMCYMSQIANSVLLVVDDSTDILKKDLTFKVHAKDHDKEKTIASGINERFGLNPHLKKPDLEFEYIILDDKEFLCINMSGDLSKRDYKIFNHSMSLKGTTAFGLLMLAGYQKNDSILDTFCNSGVIAIEAALYSSATSLRKYNKAFPFTKIIKTDIMEKIDKESRFKGTITASDPLLSSIAASKKNAKIAGVSDYIDFRRIDTDWLDLKFKEKSIDKVITFIPGSSKRIDINKLKKVYKEFFYQAEYILKDKGTVNVLCISSSLLIDSSKEYFKLYKEAEFYSGEQCMKVLTFRKNHKDGTM